MDKNSANWKKNLGHLALGIAIVSPVIWLSSTSESFTASAQETSPDPTPRVEATRPSIYGPFPTATPTPTLSWLNWDNGRGTISVSPSSPPTLDFSYSPLPNTGGTASIPIGPGGGLHPGDYTYDLHANNIGGSGVNLSVTGGRGLGPTFNGEVPLGGHAEFVFTAPPGQSFAGQINAAFGNEDRFVFSSGIAPEGGVAAIGGGRFALPAGSYFFMFGWKY